MKHLDVKQKRLLDTVKIYLEICIANITKSNPKTIHTYLRNQ